MLEKVNDNISENPEYAHGTPLTFLYKDKLKELQCTSGSVDIDIESIGKMLISPPYYKIASSESLVCETSSDWHACPVTSEMPEQPSLYDRIKTPVKAEYKLNFKN